MVLPETHIERAVEAVEQQARRCGGKLTFTELKNEVKIAAGIKKAGSSSKLGLFKAFTATTCKPPAEHAAQKKPASVPTLPQPSQASGGPSGAHAYVNGHCLKHLMRGTCKPNDTCSKHKHEPHRKLHGV